MQDKNTVDILRLMLTSRAIEEREGILLRQGKSWMQIPCAGHEGTIALVYQLESADYLFSYYRGCHLRLAKGIGVDQLAKDFFAKADSSSGGRSVSVHCSSRVLNIFPDAAPTGSQCLPAVGTAWGQKFRGSKNLTLCSIGDGSTRQGEFYEAICFSIQEQLPIIFLVEDNGYGISTKTENLSPLNLNVFNQQYIREVNGRNVAEVYAAGQQAIKKIRAGGGPIILWCHVDRLQAHTLMEDHRRYRSSDELAAMIDPIALLKERLLSDGEMADSEITALENEIKQMVEQTYERVEQEKAKKALPIKQYLYASTEENIEPISLADIDPQPGNLLTAFNQTLHKGLAKFPDVIVIGQDIEDPKGGVFGLTADLSTAYPGRVINSPLAEATIIGTAIGLSFQGYKPVCEIQFIDFITPAFSQINTHLGNLSWRSMGQWQCPLVIYAPYGAYLPAGGLWHSDSNEAWWTHIPGLRVAIPSTPEDGAGLLATALEENIPTFLLLPKHLLRVNKQDCHYGPVPFGKARIVREGSDVTVVSWGNCVETVELAAMELDNNNSELSIEIIDLRTLVPCDWESVEQSLRKTGRLVVVHEDNQTSGFGTTLVTQMVAKAERFELLLAAPQLIARDNIPVPYRPDLERAVLPSVDDVIRSVYVVCGKTSRPIESVVQKNQPMTKKSLNVPQLGEGLTTVKIVTLYKQAGEQIKKDEVLYSVETDKATVDIESPFAGKLIDWSVQVNEIIDVGALVAYIIDETDVKTVQTENPVVVNCKSESPTQHQHHSQWPTHTNTGVFIPPVTRVYCGKKGLRPDQVAAITTQGQALTPDMIDAYLNNKSDHNLSNEQLARQSNVQTVAQDSCTNAYVIKPISEQQRWLNTHFKHSREKVIPATLTSFVSLQALKVLNKSVLNNTAGNTSKKYISEFQLFAYLVSRVLVKFPKLRSVLQGEDQYREFQHVNLGVAVQTEQGELVTAVVNNADTLDKDSFLAELKTQIEKAMTGEDQANENMAMVLSYMGGGNILFGSPLLVSPAVATLFFSTPDDERKKQDGRAYLSLTFDHRLINGMEATRFLDVVNTTLNQFILDEKENHQTLNTLSLNNKKNTPAVISKDKLSKILIDEISRLLDVLPSTIDKKESLGVLGLDSIKSLSLKNYLERQLSIELFSTLLWHYPTISALEDYLTSQVKLKSDSVPTSKYVSAEPSIPASDTEVSELVSDLNTLSVEEQQRILSEIDDL